jgi:predicted ATP-binding protein involved in virulence
MYLKNIIIENMGAIERFELLEKDLIKENKQPRVIILVGQNGSGKTTLLSSIVDAFYEFEINYLKKSCLKMVWDINILKFMVVLI